MSIFRKKIITFLIFFLIANILLILAISPKIIRIMRTPQDHMAPIVQGDINPLDYFLYLSAIKEGESGYWLYQD
ncbi:hypothetical protein HY029_06295 [Candidatus Gottesmanbacteria bacterium]|nr:hypothetical protein [Candidatus Gottesmanbacteria bacterium]